MGFQQQAQVAFFVLFKLVGLDKFQIEHVIGLATKDVAEATGHTGTEIQADRTKNGRETASHVFATVLSDPFDNRGGTAVANGKALAGLAGDVELAGGRTVQDRVSGEYVAALRGVLAGVDDNVAAGESFGDVIVGFAV